MSPIDQQPRRDQRSPEDKRKTADDPAVVKRNREGMVFTALLAAALVSTIFPLPAKLISGVFAIAALVWAVRFFIAGVRSRQPGGWIFMGILGALASVFMLLQSLGTAVLYPQQKAYEECVASALTEQAAVSCQTEHRSQLQKMIEDLGSVG